MTAPLMLAGLIIGYILGTTLLYLSVRFIGKAHGHLSRACVTYLAMVLGGGLIGGVIFYVSTEVGSLRPLAAFITSLTCAAFCQWAIGLALFRRIAVHPGLSIAIPVVLLYLLACISGISVVAKAEQRALQTRQLSELRVMAREIASRLFENDTMNLPVPASLQAIISKDLYSQSSFPLSELEFLPQWLARSGMLTNSYKFEDLDAELPFLWLKQSKAGKVPVVSCNGGCRIMDSSELERQLKMAAEQLTRILSPLPQRVWRNKAGSEIATGSFVSIGPEPVLGGGVYLRLSPGRRYTGVTDLSSQDLEYLRSLGVLIDHAMR
jgi:hypothetical protein